MQSQINWNLDIIPATVSNVHSKIKHKEAQNHMHDKMRFHLLFDKTSHSKISYYLPDVESMSAGTVLTFAQEVIHATNSVRLRH